MLGRREAVIKNPMADVNYRHNNDNENCIETLNSHKAHYITSCLYKEEGGGGVSVARGYNTVKNTPIV